MSHVERESLLQDLDLLAKHQTGERQQGILGVCEAIRSRKPADVVERKTFTVEELKTLPLRAWVWIEVLEPFDYEEKVSAYYRKQTDYTHEKAFCCGYPGLSFSFDYEEFGKTWIAYSYEPKE